MTQIDVVFYQADDGSVPALDALIDLQKSDPKVALKFQALIEALAEQGYNLMRPMVGNLRDGISDASRKSKGCQP